MAFNAYDLRLGKYRYLRGDSEYVDWAESLFDNAILMPSGMSAISLAMQYFRPESIWYPKDLYQGTMELIELSRLWYNIRNPDMVIYDYPSFAGVYHKNPLKDSDAVTVVDNSVEPDLKPECDILVTSLSKYHTDCQSVLGLLTVNTGEEDLEKMRELRWKSGYVILKEQVDAFAAQYMQYGNDEFNDYITQFKRKAAEIGRILTEMKIKNVVSGGLVFIMVPDDWDTRELALLTPFELRPTYGSKHTLCCYSYCEDNYRYFGNQLRLGKYIRVSPGLDMTEYWIAMAVKKAFQVYERSRR